MKGLTPRQREILDFIEQGIRRGLPPTFREINRRFGFSSTNAANDHLVALEQKGYLVRGPPGSRRTLALAYPLPALRATHTVQWLVPEHQRP